MQRRIHTRIVDYDCGILRFRVRALLRKIIYQVSLLLLDRSHDCDSIEFYFSPKFEHTDLFLTIIISFVFLLCIFVINLEL